jgi:hypothetical protein
MDDIYEARWMTERADGTHLSWERNSCEIAVYSVHTECPYRNGESGKDGLFGITTCAKSAWGAKKSECIKGKYGLEELNRRGS